MTAEDADRRRDPSPLSALLEEMTRRRGWRRRLESARVHDHWGEIAGQQLAHHSEPVRLQGGVLVVRVDSPEWATQVRYLAGDLAGRANAVLGEGQVGRVSVVTGALRHETPETPDR